VVLAYFAARYGVCRKILSIRCINGDGKTSRIIQYHSAFENSPIPAFTREWMYNDVSSLVYLDHVILEGQRPYFFSIKGRVTYFDNLHSTKAL